jgi:Family of unknown function (DUF5318)
MPRQRQVIDYALARRATLTGLAQGRLAAADACDAHPDLLRAARYHGEVTETGCPVCRQERLTRVTYAYGDELQHASGRARSSRSLEALAARFAQLRIYVVEVCRSCGWNHLCVSFMIGTDVTADAAAPGGRSPGGVPDVVPVTRREAPPKQRRTARQ